MDADIAADRGRRIESWLFARAQARPHDEILVDGARRLDAAALAAAARTLAGALAERGVAPGDRVAILLDKSVEAVVAFYGAWLAGAVAVPIHESLKAPQVRHILTDSGAVALVIDDKKRSRLEPGVADGVSVVDPGAHAAPIAQARTDRADGEPAVILYTSGSTGRPKGILIAHDQLAAGARIVSRYLEIDARERILSVLPFSFDYGLNQLLTAVRQGATLVLQRSHHPADICRALVDERITGLAGVPPFWIQLMQRQSPFASMAFPSLRYITNSGGVFPLELVARYRAHLPHVKVFLMYGLSEAFRSSYLPPDQIDARSGSMGRAIPETDLFVVRDDDTRCEPGEVRQLVHAGPTVALGYFRDPERTAAVFRPHPFKPGSSERVVYSGDLVRADADGFLYFVGRRDQQMKSHGFRISPEEVEEIVQRAGLVAEVVARGEPDDVAGQAVVLHVVPRQPDTFTSDALLAYCRREMPRYMVPARIYVHADLPRTSSGKVDRKQVGA